MRSARLFACVGLLVPGLLGLAAGCGFQLRGAATQLPPEYATLRVTVSGSAQANDPLLTTVRDTLRSQSGARLVEDADAPTVVLSDERVESQVISVQTATAKASEYRLRYSVNFTFNDGAGRTLLPPQTIRMQRDYTSDPARVLAKEQEERELLREMRRDAAQQIARRIAKAAGQSR